MIIKYQTLILHHHQMYWEDSLHEANTSFNQQNIKAMAWIIEHVPLKVIVTMFEQPQPDYEHQPLIDLCDELGIDIEFREYGYGWRMEHYTDKRYTTLNEGIDWVLGQRWTHDSENDIIPLEDWMKELADTRVAVGGAFKEECLCDMQVALEAVGAYACMIDKISV